MYLVPVVQTLGSAIHRRDREVRLERVEINLVFKRIFEAIPHVCPRVKAHLAVSARGLGTKTLFKAPHTF